MKVRRLTDVAVFRDLRLEALTRSPDDFASELSEWSDLDDAEWWARMTAARVHAVEVGGEPVGLAGYLLAPQRRMCHRATLVMVYLRQSARGGGAARLLIEDLLRDAQVQGARLMELGVSADNHRAIAFYEKLGFEKTGRVPGAFLLRGRYIDEVNMVRPLAP